MTKNTSKFKNENQIWLYGKHAIFGALQKKKRKVFEILATRNSVAELEKFLNSNSLSALKSQIKLTDNDRIEKFIGPNQVHQGLAMLCSKLPLQNQNDLLTELYAINNKNDLPTLLLLDQISDPHNIGAIIRSAASFGVKKIIFPEHNCPKENATIVKSSAGTIDMVDLVEVVNFSNLFEKIKKIGYWCIGLDGNAKTLVSEIKDYKNIALVIGSEGNGIRDLVKKNCDILAKITIDKDVESLNASVAASIALYELKR